MCRHFAYSGPPLSLREAIIDPPHGLYRQAWAPRYQRHGTVNADGFGIGWYVPHDPVPARYRRTVPIWTDSSFTEVARVTRTGLLLAAVRDATADTSMDEAAVAPFAAGPWLFSHNGAMAGWPDSEPVARLAGTLPLRSLLSLEARVDSALLWALVLNRLRGGASPAGALASVLAELDAAGVDGRFNFLLTDGESIAASTAGDTLWYRALGGAVVVASEPSDDAPGWVSVPDRHVLQAADGDVAVTNLERIAIA